MATTILTVNEHHESFNDVDLLIVVRMVVLSIADDRSGELSVVKRRWERAIEARAPGVVDLGIEECANDANLRRQLAELLESLETRLSALGDEVPVARLLGNRRLPGIAFREPYPTHHLVSAARRLRELIGRGG